MHVLVTGANGLIGAETVRQLVDAGYSVRAIDVGSNANVDRDVDYVSCDIRDFDAVRQAVQGCDRVVHLAALPSPTHDTGPMTFDINVTGTYNVFEAAAQAGIRRVAQASSVNAIGMTWNLGDFVPDALPLDERQTLRTADPYSLSKQLDEEIGAYFWRRDGVSSVALRLPGVYPASFYRSADYSALRDKAAGFIDDFAAWPAPERERLLNITRQRVFRYRSERSLEYATRKPAPQGDELGEIPPMLWETVMWYRYMLWALIDVRDAARAFILALEADFEGSHPLFVNDTGNFADYDARTLADLFFPGVPVRDELTGKDALISTRRARALIGFVPEYSVRES